MKPLELEADYKSLTSSYDTWLFDCDGVIWHDDHLVDGAIEVLSYLRNQKKHLIFVTNNATKSRRNLKAKFDKLGVHVEMDEIFGSAYASAIYLSSVVKLPKDKKVYVIGEGGIEEELKEEGFEHLGGTHPDDNTLKPFSLDSFVLDPTVGAVLCGLDRYINYTKYSKAFQYLTRNEGCLFVVTNEDSTYPASGGILPGGGSILAPLKFALKRNATPIGKPNQTMLDCIKAKHDFDPSRTIMVGDRLETDIEFGKKGGLATLLVLTGITTKADLDQLTPERMPDYVTGSLGDLRF
ncbi:p-nitrophenyl phosphatase [Hysterangium stoloniferum]|nr:p-nitrophenyl phosphatase [Hysterangium stoloniferum]